MERLTLKIVNKNLCNYNLFFVRTIYGHEFYICVQRTATNKFTLKDINGKSFDKSFMSDWFKSYDYYAIYSYSANKQEMIETIINELREKSNQL